MAERVHRKNIWICCKVLQNSQGMEVESGDQQVVCYRAGGETGKVVVEEWRERADCLPDSQAGVDPGFPARECF